MATKYKQYVDRMLDSEKEVFASFKEIHDKYALDEDTFQEAFNKKGEKILEILNEWENKLCNQSEKGGYSAFTPKLAEKFREEVKKHFPFIDHIGIKVQFAPIKPQAEDSFKLKRINL